MERPRLSYGSRSLAAFGVLVILTQLFHPIIVMPLTWGITASWLLVLLAGAFTVLLAWPVAAALRAYPGGDLIDLAQAAFGPIGRVTCGVMLATLLTFMCGVIVRQTGEMALTAAFPHTPQTVVIVALFLGAIFVAWGDAHGLVRLGRVVLPLSLAAILLVVFWSVPWGQLPLLMPFWGPGFIPVVLSAPLVAMLFAPMVLLYLLTGGVQQQTGLVGWLLAVPAIASVLLALAKLMLAIVFPYPVGVAITFPFHAASRIVMSGRFFERMDGIWLFTWAACTAVMTGGLLWGAATALTRAFGIRRHTTVIPPLAAVALSVAYFATSQADTLNVQEAAAALTVAVALVLPALIALVVLLRRWRGHRS